MKRLALATLIMAVGAAPAVAQLGLPRPGEVLEQPVQAIDRTLGEVERTIGNASSAAQSLAEARLDRISRLVRRNGGSIERDSKGDPARKGELLLLDPAPGAIDVARAAGFAVLSREVLGELGMTVVRLGVPAGIGLSRAEALLARLLPEATISADTLSFRSGDVKPARKMARAAAPMPTISTPVGVIDGGAAAGLAAGEVRGFVRGAPRASDHGSAVASLLAHAGVQRVLIADVYGSDPAGGNAAAIVQALDWLLGREVRVVSISLVGPANPVVARAIAQAQRRGTILVAAVGNDGPAAPPAYPASYPGVIAVTAVDGRNRALIEAGRALHLDYAAPGADMLAANAAGRWVKVRGTSFAAPFAASRVAKAMGGDVIARLNAEAIDLGASGADNRYGRGLLCVICRRTR